MDIFSGKKCTNCNERFDNISAFNSKNLTVNEQALAAKLQQANLPCLSQIRQLSMLSHGLNQASLVVSVAQEKQQHALAPSMVKYYVKYVGQHAVTASTQINCALSAADLGIAPQVIAYDEDWLVCEFVKGRALVDLPDSDNDKINICLALMAKWHALAAHHCELPTLDLKQQVKQRLNVLSLRAPQKQGVEDIVTQLLAANYDLHLVPCHGDLNFSNVLSADQKNHRCWLIDYEYACLAAAEYDLAMMLAVNDLPLTNLAQLQKRYNKCSPTKRQLNLELLKHYLCFAYLVNGLWYLQQAKSRQDKNLAKLARDQFDGFDLCSHHIPSLAQLLSE